jgi:hypothetical protein
MLSIERPSIQELLACCAPLGNNFKRLNSHVILRYFNASDKGDRARAEKLSSKRRSEIARKAAAARWAKAKPDYHFRLIAFL